MIYLARLVTAASLLFVAGCSERAEPSHVTPVLPTPSTTVPQASAINAAMGEDDLRSRMEAIWPFTVSSAKSDGRTARTQTYNGIPIAMTMNLAASATDWSFLDATFPKKTDLPPDDAELVLAGFADDLRWAGLPVSVTLMSETESDIAEWRWERTESDHEYSRRLHFRLKYKK